MTLKEIEYLLCKTTTIKSNKKIKGIKTDTRNINKGDIFIALKGKNYDGHDFIADAINLGAIACITERYINDKCIVVSDTFDALFILGNHIRKKNNIPLIAITGSNGKTTTKDLISHILDSKYNVLKNEESKNNIVGVSHTLFKLNNKIDIIVMELGTNHLGEINILSKMCMPSTSIITNIGTSHLEYFKTRKNIFKEKLSILDGMTSNDLIINGDDKYLNKLNYYKCGLANYNDLKAYNIESNIDYISFNIFIDKEYKIKFNNPGKHFVVDILLAIKVALDYGINIKDIISRIGSFKLTNKRMNITKVGTNVIINDCYNSSLESITAGINYIKLINQKKVLIIGDILELGKFSKKFHKRINKLLKPLDNIEVLTLGTYSKYIKGIHFDNIDNLINYIKNKKYNNCYIYIKGSRRMNLDKVVSFLLETIF